MRRCDSMKQFDLTATGTKQINGQDTLSTLEIVDWERSLGIKERSYYKSATRKLVRNEDRDLLYDGTLPGRILSKEYYKSATRELVRNEDRDLLYDSPLPGRRFTIRQYSTRTHTVERVDWKCNSLYKGTLKRQALQL